MVFLNANYSLSLGGHIVSYTWNFGDGTPLVKTATPQTNHDYFGYPSQWLVTLTVQDSYGMSDAISQMVVFDVVLQFSFHPAKPFAGRACKIQCHCQRLFFHNDATSLRLELWGRNECDRGSRRSCLPETWSVQNRAHRDYTSGKPVDLEDRNRKAWNSSHQSDL